jgi:hypothetical protein
MSFFFFFSAWHLDIQTGLGNWEGKGDNAIGRDKSRHSAIRDSHTQRTTERREKKAMTTTTSALGPVSRFAPLRTQKKCTPSPNLAGACASGGAHSHSQKKRKEKQIRQAFLNWLSRSLSTFMWLYVLVFFFFPHSPNHDWVTSREGWAGQVARRKARQVIRLLGKTGKGGKYMHVPVCVCTYRIVITSQMKVLAKL